MLTSFVASQIHLAAIKMPTGDTSNTGKWRGAIKTSDIVD